MAHGYVLVSRSEQEEGLWSSGRVSFREAEAESARRIRVVCLALVFMTGVAAGYGSFVAARRYWHPTAPLQDEVSFAARTRGLKQQPSPADAPPAAAPQHDGAHDAPTSVQGEHALKCENSRHVVTLNGLAMSKNPVVDTPETATRILDPPWTANACHHVVGGVPKQGAMIPLVEALKHPSPLVFWIWGKRDELVAQGVHTLHLFERDYVFELYNDLPDYKLCKLMNAADLRSTLAEHAPTGQARPFGLVFGITHVKYQALMPSLEIPGWTPAAVFELSDQWGRSRTNKVRNQFDSKWAQMSHNDSGIILRQHHWKHRYKYQLRSEGGHVQVPPLGYMYNYLVTVEGRNSTNGDDTTLDSCATARESLKSTTACRSYNWTFVGSLKMDRWQMLQVLNQSSLGANFVTTPARKIKLEAGMGLLEYYRDAVFAPNGRGNNVLDCFRLYEAAIAGAIPVVVGEEDEIDHFFAEDGNLYPFVYARTWKEASKKIQVLLHGPGSELDSMRERIVDWWCDQMRTTKSLVRESFRV